MTDRFLSYKIQDLQKDGYDMYEIEDILYNMLNENADDEYDSTSDYDSEDSYDSF